MKFSKNGSLVRALSILVPALASTLSTSGYPVGHAELQGKRPTMEDAYNVTKADGLYDGHGGSIVSNQLSYNLNYYIAENVKKVALCGGSYGDCIRRYCATVRHNIVHFVAPELEKPALSKDRFDEQIRDCLKKSYKQVNGLLDKERCSNQGSTAITALIIHGTLFVANAGDSRAVLSHDGVALSLSDDHKPNRPDEYERIIKAGGQVIKYGVPRVQGVLALSRAMGDFELNPYVICDPEVVCKKIENGDQFLILACDGVWDVLSNQEAVDIVRRELSQSDDLTTAANALVQAAYKAGSTDNISALVIAFDSLKS